MHTIIIDRKGTALSISNRRLRIAVPNIPLQHIPLTLIERLIIYSTVTIESTVITALAAQGASVVLFSPRQHERTAILHAPYGRDAEARFLQCAAACHEAESLALAKRLIRAKLYAQQRNLTYWQQTRQSSAIRTACRQWPSIRRKAMVASTVESLRGLEGGAASLYFAAMTTLVPAGLHFTGRKRRPPPDPVNALLSLSYTLLHHDAVQTLIAQGLDPAIGFIHCAEYSRASLACDIIEPLRPSVDEFVLQLFHQHTLRNEDFNLENGACLLEKAGRSHYFSAWEEHAVMQRKWLLHMVRHLKRTWKS